MKIGHVDNLERAFSSPVAASKSAYLLVKLIRQACPRNVMRSVVESAGLKHDHILLGNETVFVAERPSK